MHLHAVDGLRSGELSARIVVELLAGDDVHVCATACEVKRKISEDLAGGGMVREEEAIEKNEPLHRLRWRHRAAAALLSAHLKRRSHISGRVEPERFRP